MNTLKKTSILLSVSVCCIMLTFNSSAQNIGINESGATPDNSALLDLNSNDKGFLITRVDTANIASPAFGLMTLAPADSCLYMYSGAAWISLGGVGSNCGGSSGGSGNTIPNITSTTGEIWMDRNLGASQVATSSTDPLAIGDLYQWGRLQDGHEKRTSGTTTTQSPTDDPGHSDFIYGNSDWRNPKNDNLWQGVAGNNNPCPSGYRLPTETELNNERLSWSSDDAAGALNSPLKLPLTGLRMDDTGIIVAESSDAKYWSSSIYSDYSISLDFYSGGTSMYNANTRTSGMAVRCIKD